MTLVHSPLQPSLCEASSSCAAWCLVWLAAEGKWSASSQHVSTLPSSKKAAATAGAQGDGDDERHAVTCSLLMDFLASDQQQGGVMAVSVWQVAVATETTARHVFPLFPRFVSFLSPSPPPKF